MRRTTQSSTRSSNPLRRRDRLARALAAASVLFGVSAGCDTPRAGVASASASSVAASASSSAGTPRPSRSSDSEADVTLRRERAAAFVTFYESFVKAVAENTEDCDKMGAALEAFTADENNVKKLASIDEDAADDPRLAGEVDKLTGAIDAKYPRFDEGVQKCATNAKVREAMKKIALAP